MAFVEANPINDRRNPSATREDGKVSGRFLSRVYLYLGIGLVITAIVSYGFAFLISRLYGNADGTLQETGFMILLVAAIVGLVVSLIDSIFLMICGRRQSANVVPTWIAYVIYCLAMAPIFSLILMIGISPSILLEAFGITVGAFIIMFLIGTFSKVNLSPLAFIGITLALGLGLCSIVYLILALVNGGAWGLYALHLGIMVGFLIVMLLFTIYDIYQIKKLDEAGFSSNNMALYCAYTLYNDFITVLLRVLYILMLVMGKKN